MSAPLPFRWDGEHMTPLPGFRKNADRQYVVGEVYHLDAVEERSPASHRHYFATVNEAFQNLPEHLAERFFTADHLRKYCLIKAGYADNRQLVASSKAEALRLASFIRPMDEYALVSVEQNIVNVWTAQSQSMRDMGKARFQESKDAVLSILASVVGVSPKQLSDNAERAA